MSDTLKPPVSPLALRDKLETMVLKELLGPGSEAEEITESPGTHYFVGVLAPRKRGGWKWRVVRKKLPFTLHPPPATIWTMTKWMPMVKSLTATTWPWEGRDTSQDGTTDQAPAQDKATFSASARFRSLLGPIMPSGCSCRSLYGCR